MENNFEEKYQKYLDDIDRKEKNSFKRLALLSLIPISIALFFTYQSVRTIDEKDSAIEVKSNEILLRDSVYNELKDDVLKTFTSLKDSNKVQIDSVTRGEIERTEQKLKNLPQTMSESGPTIVRYYKRKSDNSAISNSIEELGFYLNVRPVSNDTANISVNVIFYGDSVKKEEVKKLALELLKTDNNFREIVNYKLSEDYKWKIKAIEIGYDSKYDNYPKLSIEDVEKRFDGIK